MKNTMYRALAVPAAMLLLLAGCGVTGEVAQDEAPAAADAPAEDPAEAEAEGEVDDPMWGPGTYTAETETGAVLTIEIPGTAPEDIESYRDTVGVDPVGYVTVEIDNTNGTEYLNVSDLSIVNGAGETLEYESAFIQFEDWGPSMFDDGPENVNDGYYFAMPDGTEVSEDEYDVLDDQGTELYDTYLEDGALPGAKVTATLIGPTDVPDEIAYVEAVSALVSIPVIPAE